jgi:cAMP-binding proteins - catabolite gene activator and regulatory subunit of cAMP-dependent protein kinases
MRSTAILSEALAPRDVDWLADVVRPRRFDSGDVLIAEGAAPATLWLVLSGEAVVATKAAGVVARVGVGDLLGEVSFVDRLPATATVAADGPVVAAEIPCAPLETRLAENGEFSVRFYKALAAFLARRLRVALGVAAAGEGLASRRDADEEGAAAPDPLTARLRARLDA